MNSNTRRLDELSVFVVFVDFIGFGDRKGVFSERERESIVLPFPGLFSHKLVL